MRRILIADDNDAIVDILKSFAEAEGYETVTAGDGEAALSVFQKEHFDAVLLDVMMPKLDGFEVCRAIRRVSNVPVLMITARGEDYDRIMGLD
ncbi:MAG: response regulator, partial [Schwartzia sp.]|nr:response regulator [Schwartzia sp. (in: firmicutes)]